VRRYVPNGTLLLPTGPGEERATGLHAGSGAMTNACVPSALADDLDALLLRLETELTVPGPTETNSPPPSPPDRRLSTRVDPQEIGRDVQLTVRGAAAAKPINLSETGALAETTSRLLPGTVVELLLQIDGVRHLLRATIMRSVVHALTPRPVFRTAFRFEKPAKFPERR
jgi:hypothetical protein